MANPDIEIDLVQLHQGIETAIRAQFPSLKLVEFYREEDDRTPPTQEQLPACLLELSEMEPSGVNDPGTEQLAVSARFAARVILGFRTPRAKIEIRKLAASLGVFLRAKRWPDPTRPGKVLPTGPGEVIAMMPDEFDPALDRFEVWRVEWTHDLHLGESVWTDAGVTPDTPMYSWAPKIGTGNEHHYRASITDATAGITSP